MASDLVLLPCGTFGILIILCHVLTLLLTMWHNYASFHATLSWILYLRTWPPSAEGTATTACIMYKTREQGCRFKSTSCPVSVIQTLISACLISSLPLRHGHVTAWLHIQCLELKLPKAPAPKRWINHLDFLRTTANHLGVRPALPPLIIRIEKEQSILQSPGCSGR